MKKIYDCFAFFNELDLLELRLNELYPVVDHFVLVEATRTFQKKEKPLYYNLNKDRFHRFHDKIIHIVVDAYPGFFAKWRIPNAWDYDNYQKEQILNGLTQAQPEDQILVSDLDEIPLAEKVLQMKDQPGIKVFEQFMCFYYLNNVCTYCEEPSQIKDSKNKNGYGFWRGSVMMPYAQITSIKEARKKRDLPPGHIQLVEKSGWHFSYMGGVDKIVQKIESWAHKEYNTPENKNPQSILKFIREGKSLFDKSLFRLDDMKTSSLPYPQSLLKNLEQYKHMILDPRDNP